MILRWLLVDKQLPLGIFQKMMEEFTTGEVGEKNFRFCGKEVVQEDDYSIKVTAKDNIEKIALFDLRQIITSLR